MRGWISQLWETWLVVLKLRSQMEKEFLRGRVVFCRITGESVSLAHTSSVLPPHTDYGNTPTHQVLQGLLSVLEWMSCKKTLWKGIRSGLSFCPLICCGVQFFSPFKVLQPEIKQLAHVNFFLGRNMSVVFNRTRTSVPLRRLSIAPGTYHKCSVGWLYSICILWLYMETIIRVLVVLCHCLTDEGIVLGTELTGFLTVKENKCFACCQC